MTRIHASQPDITLVLDERGIIQDVTLSDFLSGEVVKGWIGQPWGETVVAAGDDKVKRMVADARANRVSVFRQVTQRFPSGREVLMEYTTVRVGGKAGVIAIGRSLQAMADLQSRLIAAQQTLERDYWKMREIETRYRRLFTASSEGVLLVRASDLRVIEANPEALRAIGRDPEAATSAVGCDFLADVVPDERQQFQATLLRVREHGEAPPLWMRLGEQRESRLVRISLMSSEPSPVFLLQLSPAAGNCASPQGAAVPVLDTLIANAPDGFVVLDEEGGILKANHAFVEMVQAGTEAAVVGQRLSRWLGRPGADLSVLLANIRQYGVARLFSTSIHGQLGMDTDVEISAAGQSSRDSRHIGVILRDVSRRLQAPSKGSGSLEDALGSLTEQIGKSKLPKLVEKTVSAVERHYIEAALKLTEGNRTAAAEMLGISRQSLYMKLDRYGFEGRV